MDARDESGLTALYHAAFRGDRENVEGLLQHGANVNSEHHLLGTPIAVAALRGHSEVVETLLLFKADILRFLPGLGSALHCACFGGDTGIFTSIMHDPSPYDYLTSYQVINLKAFSIISSKDLNPSGILRLLMKELDCQGPSIRCYPIFLAAERCNFDIKLLCKHAVAPFENLGFNKFESCGMDAALYRALRNSAAEPIIPILLDHGASPNAETYELPLITANFSEASEDVVTALLERGADGNLRPKSGLPITPLEYAKQRDRRDMIALFTSHDAVSSLPKLMPSGSTGPRAADTSLRRIQSSRSQASITVLGSLNDVDEADELEDLGEEIVDQLNPTDFVGSSRLWFPGIPSFPLSRFRRSSKHKQRPHCSDSGIFL